jgi:hypothetical protein
VAWPPLSKVVSLVDRKFVVESEAPAISEKLVPRRLEPFDSDLQIGDCFFKGAHPAHCALMQRFDLRIEAIKAACQARE